MFEKLQQEIKKAKEIIEDIETAFDMFKDHEKEIQKLIEETINVKNT